MYVFWPQLFLTIHLPSTSCRCITPLPQWLCRWNNRVVHGMHTLFPLPLPWLHIALVIAETLACRGEDDLLSLSWWTCWNTFSSAKMQVHGVEEEERFSSIYQSWLVSKQLLPECLPSPLSSGCWFCQQLHWGHQGWWWCVKVVSALVITVV